MSDDTTSSALGTRLERTAAAAAASRQLAEDDLQARNQAIREADAAGWSIRQIVERVRLSTSTVHGIILGRR
jgi:hypothetical protein